MYGWIFCIAAGAAMSLQGVLNTRLSDRIGNYKTNFLVQGTAFVLSVPAMLIMKQGSFSALRGVPAVYLLGGVLGFAITVTVIIGTRALGPASAVSAILIAQLFFASLIEAMGWFETEKAPFGFNKYLGLALMTGGILVFRGKSG